MKNPIRLALTTLLIVVPLTSTAQIGKYRNTFSIGANAGAAMSSVGFDPSVSQGQHVGLTGGLSWRYTSEKYFSTICSIAGEVNFAAIGWKEDIRDANDNPVVNTNGSVEKYSRTLNYILHPGRTADRHSPQREYRPPLRLTESRCTVGTVEYHRRAGIDESRE